DRTPAPTGVVQCSAARNVSGWVDHWSAEDTRHGDHRQPGTGEPVILHRGHRLHRGASRGCFQHRHSNRNCHGPDNGLLCGRWDSRRFGSGARVRGDVLEIPGVLRGANSGGRVKSELPRYVHVNGRLVSAHRPWISVFDRGFLYGDGLFETLRAYRGRVFGLQHHLSRLRMSARFLGIALPHHDWAKEIAALLARNRFLNADAWVRITLTRGVAPPALPPTGGGQPTLIISAGPIHSSITRAQQLGVAVTLLPFARQGFL